MTFVIDFIKGLVAKEPTRLVAYASALAVAGALKLAELAGVSLSAEILAGVAGLTALIVTELIRRFVFSPATTQTIADNATYLPPGTPVDIGNPPEGPQG